jgi:hypothetical protein
MKRKLLSMAIGAIFSGSVFAAPIALPTGGIYFQFTNLEQVDVRVDAAGNPVNGIDNQSGGTEGNWGIAQLSVIRAGTPNPAAAQPGDIGNDIDNAGTPPVFADQLFPVFGGQVTAMFYGIQQTSVTSAGTVISLASTGGFIDLYWDQPGLAGAGTTANIGAAGTLPGGRTGESTYTGFTDGEFLVRLAFASGIDAGDSTTFIQGTIDTSLANNSGSADSYANVVDINNDGVIDDLDGSWAGKLDSDWFGTVFGTRDVRFSNKIDVNTDWNGAPGILGLTSNDPGRAFGVPEPTTLALVGLSLLGLGVARRRKAA